MREELARGEPWWVEAAVEFLDRYLETHPINRAFEWGAGASTLWLQERARIELISIEHQAEWAREVEAVTEERRLDNPILADVTVVHISNDLGPGPYGAYAAAIDAYEGTFDLVAIDGRARVECGRHAVAKLSPGGILVLDNSERPEYHPFAAFTEAWTRAEFYKGPHTSFPRGWGTTIWFKPR